MRYTSFGIRNTSDYSTLFARRKNPRRNNLIVIRSLTYAKRRGRGGGEAGKWVSGRRLVPTDPPERGSAGLLVSEPFKLSICSGTTFFSTSYLISDSVLLLSPLKDNKHPIIERFFFFFSFCSLRHLLLLLLECPCPMSPYKQT
jgi:hypothetical protein